MNQYVVALLWAVAGGVCGWGVRWGSVRLAKLEGLQPGNKPWQVWGPPVLGAVVFAVYGYWIEPFPVLLARSVFALVLVQVVFFDLEHRLILDRVMFPSMALALVFAFTGPPWWPGGTFFGKPLVLDRPFADALLTGLGAGMLFLGLALAGSALFKQEALGFGDVKLALFMGLLLGWPYTFTAIFYGVFLAGLISIGIIIWHRSMRGTIAYGPYLAAGALILLLDPLK